METHPYLARGATARTNHWTVLPGCISIDRFFRLLRHDDLNDKLPRAFWAEGSIGRTQAFSCGGMWRGGVHYDEADHDALRRPAEDILPCMGQAIVGTPSIEADASMRHQHCTT